MNDKNAKGLNLDQIVRELKISKFVLSEITNFNDETPELTDFLKRTYYNANCDLSKITVTIINSILTHQRIHFILTRDAIRRLISTDCNHKVKPKFSNKDYRTLLLVLLKAGVTCRVPNDRRKAAIFTTENPELLHLLPKEASPQQLEEVTAFVNSSDSDVEGKSLMKKDRRENLEDIKYEERMSEKEELTQCISLNQETHDNKKEQQKNLCNSILKKKSNAFASSCLLQIEDGNALSDSQMSLLFKISTAGATDKLDSRETNTPTLSDLPKELNEIVSTYHRLERANRDYFENNRHEVCQILKNYYLKNDFQSVHDHYHAFKTHFKEYYCAPKVYFKKIDALRGVESIFYESLNIYDFFQTSPSFQHTPLHEGFYSLPIHNRYVDKQLYLVGLHPKLKGVYIWTIPNTKTVTFFSHVLPESAHLSWDDLVDILFNNSALFPIGRSDFSQEVENEGISDDEE